MRAERGSKAAAADVTRAIIIIRNMLIPLGGHPLRDSFSRENIPSPEFVLFSDTVSPAPCQRRRVRLDGQAFEDWHEN
jgi:hypothetical protein